MQTARFIHLKMRKTININDISCYCISYTVKNKCKCDKKTTKKKDFYKGKTKAHTTHTNQN